ncbi:MAG TPA: tryptophan halogenase family protein [Asticcacaulis sp.]|nr:tryptophan halogenase family protein [Asticcacaulis sp.]
MAPRLPSRRILIAGGGTAGWLTACALARKLGGAVQITVIESPDIGVIGVGEGTFPTIRKTLHNLGIDEADFLRETTATYKQGIKFVDWRRTPKGAEHEHYLHPFDAPYAADGIDLVPYWLLQDPAERAPFAQSVALQPRVAEAERAPKRPHEGDFGGPLTFAYHFDAQRFARLLQKHSAALGVRHLTGTIDRVDLADDGGIAAIHSTQHGDLTADLYVDCTGGRAELIGKALGRPLRSVRPHLFADRAVVLNVPYASPKSPIASYTVATAHEAGWTWDIGLAERRGIGYVYSSAHSSDAQAEAIVRRYAGEQARNAETRIIPFEPGYRERQWVGNCVAIGLSAGFFEPLEATGIVMIEAAASMLAEFFPFAGPIDASAERFNTAMRLRCEKIVNFLKLHYCLTRREEPFWRDNIRDDSVPEELRALLRAWRHRPPSPFDFLTDVETFAYFNYQYILYGMGFETDLSGARHAYPQTEAAAQLFERVKGFGDHAVRDLPSHRDLIEHVYRHGFRPG